MFTGKKLKEKSDNNVDLEVLLSLLDRMSAGDYSKADTQVFQDKKITESVNRLIDSIKSSNNSFVMQLNNSMKLIGDSSPVKNMIEQVNSQTIAIETIQGAGQELGASITLISETLGQIKDNAHGALDTSKSSVIAMNESISKVDESCRSFANLNAELVNLGEKVNKIDEIIDIVKGIAKKSSLLALNASIEAARAGESGKGFGVVAGEMQSLATSTATSANEIVKTVSELRYGMDSLVDLVKESTSEVEKGNEKIKESITGIHEMEHFLEEISVEIDKIFDETSTQTALTENYASSVDEIAGSYQLLSEECFETGSHLYKISRQIDKVRSAMARERSNLSTIDWITVFEVDHLIFTWRQYNNLIGYEQLKLEQVNNPDGCKLGKWINNQTDSRIKNSRELAKVKEIHNNLHRHSVDCFESAASGNRAAALKHFEEAYGCYEKLVTALNDIKRLIRNLGDTRETKY